MADPQAPVYVLGVGTGPHDGSAALLRDGELVVMVEQERLSRKRYALGESPSAAVHACLDDEGIGVADLDLIAIGWNAPELAAVEGEDFDEARFTRWLLGDSAAERARHIPVHFVDHHLAHAASAFHTSGFPRAAIIVADGRGESVATTLAVGTPDGIEVLESWGLEHSLGHFYGWAAEWAGLTSWGAGKLMGLASYGRPRQPVPLVAGPEDYAVTTAPPPGTPVRLQYAVMRSRLRERFRTANFPFAPAAASDIMAYADFAASVQHALEEALLALARAARRMTGCDTVVLAGGVALNCAANDRLDRSGLFREMWIPPVPHDAGVSLGAALLVDRELRGSRGRTPGRMRCAFWGPRAPRSEPEAVEALSRFDVEECPDGAVARRTAECLADGLVVGWSQGRAEIGQRALGARSILCDPRRRELLARVNQIKGREGWRPLAPAVPEEHWGHFFEGEPPPAAEFMLTTRPMREAATRSVPAGVHVDGTTRPQVVRPAQTAFHRMLLDFHELTGVPTVINTSFNLAGEPMVLTRGDAVETFLRSGLDVLVLDNLLIRRPVPPPPGIRTPRPRALSFTPWNRNAAGAEGDAR
ncbi:carbamoyltransferase C-terminal domain-containing protein [Streptomyces longwoodensis]|uniref:carbamoyltransferase C-terminal domain-containing protein n=1 Tax=Streptomyces longwoodensis TaxID=68231 RepID=UPI003247FD9A